MHTNVGTVDRTLRIVAAVILISLTATDTIGPWGWVSIVPLITGLFAWCPAYTLFGIKTCKIT
jgi:hypothetical protein